MNLIGLLCIMKVQHYFQLSGLKSGSPGKKISDSVNLKQSTSPSVPLVHRDRNINICVPLLGLNENRAMLVFKTYTEKDDDRMLNKASDLKMYVHYFVRQI